MVRRTECIEKCGGYLAIDLFIETGVFDTSEAVACGKCGRLHWPEDGTGVTFSNGDRAFIELNNHNSVYRKPVDKQS